MANEINIIYSTIRNIVVPRIIEPEIYSILFPDMVITDKYMYMVKLAKEIYNLRNDNSNDIFYVIVFGSDTVDKLYVESTIPNELRKIDYENITNLPYICTSTLAEDYILRNKIPDLFPIIDTYEFKNVKIILMTKKTSNESNGIHINNQLTYIGFKNISSNNLMKIDINDFRKRIQIIDINLNSRVSVLPIRKSICLLRCECWRVTPV